MYLIVFERIETMLKEEYYYRTFDDAFYHYSLFFGDNSGIYREVSMYYLGDNGEFFELHAFTPNKLKFGRWGRLWLEFQKMNKSDLFECCSENDFVNKCAVAVEIKAQLCYEYIVERILSQYDDSIISDSFHAKAIAEEYVLNNFIYK